MFSGDINFDLVPQKPSENADAKPNNKAAAARNRIQEMRLAMKAKMAEEKEKLRAEKRHHQVSVLTVFFVLLHLYGYHQGTTNTGSQREKRDGFPRVCVLA